MINFYIKEAITSFKYAKVTSIITLFITFVAVTLSALAIGSVFITENFNEQFKSKIEVNLFIKGELTNNKIGKIKKEIEKKEITTSVVYVNKEEALKEFQKDLGENFNELLKNNPLPNSFRIKLKPEEIEEKSLKKIIAELTKIDGIEDVAYNRGYVLEVLNYLNKFQIFINIIALVFVLISIYVIYTTNTLVQQAKLLQYETMKLVGASIWTIKIPVWLTGVFFGFISSVLSIICFIAINFLSDKLFGYSLSNNYKLYTIIAIFLLGIFMGTIGAFFSGRKITLEIKNFY